MGYVNFYLQRFKLITQTEKIINIHVYATGVFFFIELVEKKVRSKSYPNAGKNTQVKQKNSAISFPDFMFFIHISKCRATVSCRLLIRGYLKKNV